MTGTTTPAKAKPKGIRVQDKMAETRTITVKWGDDEADVAYYPNAVTPNVLDKADEAAGRDDMSVMGALLEPILAWWDVLDDKGKRWPTTADAIGDLPMRWLTAVNRAIQEDQDPPEPEN